MADDESRDRKSAKELQQEVMDSAHKVWLAGLGALARAEEEGSKLFRQLVERGESLEKEGRRRVDDTVEDARQEVRSRTEGVSEKLDERVTRVLRRLGVPTREEIQSLTERVEELNRRIEQAQGGDEGTSG